MSVIAVRKEKNKITIVADSQETFGESSKKNVDCIKLRKINNNCVVGGAGNGHVLSLFYAYTERVPINNIQIASDLVEYFIEFNKWAKNIIQEFAADDTHVISAAQFLLVINNKVWEFNNFYIREVKVGEMSSIGSGADQLICCMELTESITKAMEIVCKYNIHCSEPLNIVEIEYE